MTDNLYSVFDLPPEQFHQAYPLIQMIRTNLTLDQWLEYASGLHHQLDNTGGLLSVQSTTRYIYAMAAYKISSRHGGMPVIEVEHLCVLDLLNRTVNQHLIEALEQRGQAESCVEIKFCVPEAMGMTNWLKHEMPGAFLQSLGYAIDENLLSKRLQ